ncbi:serine aminopeptidase s33 [Lucifera butyrica]|uniref:Serine aminopeptidase s33 n=1 Tax=Lucifera butyrica TaxID=1351585 RepID=A0A498R415_9FIRM|nr:alpha/beta hydrolase [Lucifera butyrica]VBB05899.1 serine aminopeptidase s33 [Lucifera butyrica]
MECKLKNISLFYEIEGSGQPVLMLHGFYPDHRLMSGCMEPVFKHRNGYKRIYLDLPGMGKSKGEDWITTSDQMLAVILEFIETVVPAENFLLAGESYGGYLARGVLHKMRNRIDGLLLLCPAIIANWKKRNLPRHVVLKRDETALKMFGTKDAADFTAMAVVQDERNAQRYKEEILFGLKLADDRFLTNLQNNGYEFSFDIEAVAEQFTRPVLILTGRQDATAGYKDAWNILDSYPRATFAVLDRAGHNLQIEQETVFTVLVSEWLDRVEDLTIF